MPDDPSANCKEIQRFLQPADLGGVAALLSTDAPSVLADPTGLPTTPFGIAIPHTDCENVERGAIAVGILPQSVRFVEMGCLDDSFVDARVIVVLAIADPEAVAGVLRELALAFQDAEFITALAQSKSAKTVVGLFAAHTPAVVEVSSSHLSKKDAS